MLILMYMFVSINNNNSILGPQNIGIDAKVDILLQILIRLPGNCSGSHIVFTHKQFLFFVAHFHFHFQYPN